MSVKDPGNLFDATPSWNGYNHQGKIALWYAICEITKLINKDISHSENQKILSDYFVELEYMEDFSIGRNVGGIMQYISVHQVKKHDNVEIKHYESALLGLAKHLADFPTISGAYLHVTKELDLHGKLLPDILREMITTPRYLITIEDEINKNRNDPLYRKKFTNSKRGKPTNLKTELKRALQRKDPSAQKLTDENLDMAFDSLLKEIASEKVHFSSLSPLSLKKIELFRYPLGDKIQNYCKEDQAVILLKKAIQNFYAKYEPGSYKKDSAFVDKSYFFIMGKLDQHIVDRSLNYAGYKAGLLERQIYFSQIFDWLLSDEIDRNDDSFYLYHIKESIFHKADLYCSNCSQKRGDHCHSCQIPSFIDRIGELNFRQLEEFLRITNPQIAGDLNIKTFGQFAEPSGMNNPLLKCLRDVSQSPIQDDDIIALTYRDFERLQYALTTIAPLDTDNDESVICSEIIRNRHVYKLLMDYDCLISKDISVNSIQSEDLAVNSEFDTTMSEHIAHCRNVRIVPLTKLNQLLDEGD